MSAKSLKNSLQSKVSVPVLVVSRNSKTYQPRYTDYIINWGCSTQFPYITNLSFGSNETCTNKLLFFKQIAAWNNDALESLQVKIPEWTQSQAQAEAWQQEGHTFLARTKLNGHSGDGIIIVEKDDFHVPHAPLYVKYKKKRHEYRVHVFNGSVIDVTQKKKRKGAEFIDTKIRNHSNGWVYAREGVAATDELLRTAQCAMAAVGLQHGAVDIIWNEKEDAYYVLEINTAPGLVGQTTEAYTNAILKEITNG